MGFEAPKEEGWAQDNDVLDTWFSSTLCPFATLVWPEETEDFKRYFLTTSSAPGQDLRHDKEKVKSTWNFINKL